MKLFITRRAVCYLVHTYYEIIY